MKNILVLFVACLCISCSTNSRSESQYLLEGAWRLRHVEYPYGRTETFNENVKTILRLYDGDSLMYQCRLTQTESALVIQPALQSNVTLINKSNGDYVYIEDEYPRPLTVMGDSIIIIQQNGVLNTWHRADSIATEWNETIRDIVTTDLQNGSNSEMQSYVLSSKERKQANIIHIFLYSTAVIIIILLIIAWIAVDNRKEKRRLQLQLKQIQEVKERPQAVQQAIEWVEESYFKSEEYNLLQRRLTKGQALTYEEWDNIENQLKKIYPGFTSQLLNLHSMSELEYQVCLLIKLRIAPSDIASVLARDTSTISTVRSRLYKKVFGKKGGTKEWDDFILSIGK